MASLHPIAETVRFEFIIPARSLIGLRSELMTDTRGTAVMTHIFHEYAPYRGDLPGRKNGVLLALGRLATTYSLDALQPRGILFVGAGIEVYPGMIVGKHAMENDLIVNPCKGKKLTNMRASGSVDAIKLTPARVLTLEQALKFIEDDELVEVTPQSVRLSQKRA